MTTGAPALREASPMYDAAETREATGRDSPRTHAIETGHGRLEERDLVALWLLGRVPPAALPWPLLRPGRAGRGPGPDVREATVRWPSGTPRTGDVEVHLLASDFERHGHTTDPAYAGVMLHVVWRDDRPAGERGEPTRHAGGEAPVVEIAPHLGGEPRRVAALIARGPFGAEPCAGLADRAGAHEVAARVRAEGERRLAERAWRARALVARSGWIEAWGTLLDRALRATAGRRHETDADREALRAAIEARVGRDVLTALVARARDGVPSRIIEAFSVPGIGPGRAAEIGWNVALPLLIAAAADYGDTSLAAETARLAHGWPTPRPYGRTLALAALVGPPPPRPGALYAQGLLHLQDLWCTRGGCGVCPVSPG